MYGAIKPKKKFLEKLNFELKKESCHNEEPAGMATYDWQAGKSLAETNKYMLTNDIFCDVAFLVGENQDVVYAHKYILISRSCVFCAMLQGPLAEPGGEYISIPDIKKETFKQMLEFMYCEDTRVEIKNALPLLYASRKYGLDGLEEKCVRCLEHGITVDNVCLILSQAYTFDETELRKKCLDFIFHHPKEVLKTLGFLDLPEPMVKEIMQADELDTKEEVIFEALLRWSEMECIRHEALVCGKNERKAVGGMLYYIRFPLMNPTFFNGTVLNSDILTQEEVYSLKNFFNGYSSNVAKFRMDPRSQGESQTIHWRFGPVSCIHNEETAISFSASRAVLIEGVQIDGSVYDEEIYDADLSIFDVSNKEIAKTRTKLSIKKKQQIYNVIFPSAPKIDKGYKYTVILKIQGSHGYYGASGKSNLPLHCSSPTCVNPEGDFTKVITRRDQVPAILVKPYVPGADPGIGTANKVSTAGK